MEHPKDSESAFRLHGQPSGALRSGLQLLRGQLVVLSCAHAEDMGALGSVGTS